VLTVRSVRLKLRIKDLGGSGFCFFAALMLVKLLAGRNAASMRDDAPRDDRNPDAGGAGAIQPADRQPRTLLRRTDQVGIAALALLALVSIGGYWLTQAVVRGRVIDIEKAPPLDLGFRVDLNFAEWPELAQLPEIGESLARQIVANRTPHGSFRDVNELRRVIGIGPKKFEAVRPFLRPIDNGEESRQPSRRKNKRRRRIASSSRVIVAADVATCPRRRHGFASRKSLCITITA
jgi:competence protein ComEA